MESSMGRRKAVLGNRAKITCKRVMLSVGRATGSIRRERGHQHPRLMRWEEDSGCSTRRVRICVLKLQRSNIDKRTYSSAGVGVSFVTIAGKDGITRAKGACGNEGYKVASPPPCLWIS